MSDRRRRVSDALLVGPESHVPAGKGRNAIELPSQPGQARENGQRQEAGAAEQSVVCSRGET